MTGESLANTKWCKKCNTYHPPEYKCKPKMKIEQGVCPVCGDSLEYDGYRMQDDWVCYDVGCPNEECNWNGTEWYQTKYDNTADITGMPL